MLLSLIGCKSGSINGINIYYYKEGKKFQVDNDKIDSSLVLDIIKELIIGTNDVLRVYVDSARINNLKKDISAIEIISVNDISLNSDKFGNLIFKKMFIPLSGDFAGNENDDVITIMLGNDDYGGGPYRNPKGFSKLKELEKKIIQAIQKQ